ncbi:MAG: hypothetical protein K2Q34_03270, partial [Alphaproteobacteria bacterium]|nr:hypothetical protein [Alphaproteobacteria bacterium]
IAQNPNDWRRFDVSSRFLNSFSPSDSSSSLISSVILLVMREIAQDPNHPNQDDAMLDLWSYSLQRKDIEFSRSNLYKMVKDKKHPKRIDAAIALFNKKNNSDRDTARPVLYEVVESTNPNSRDGIAYASIIASLLLTSGDEEDKKIGEQTSHRLIHRLTGHERIPHLTALYAFGATENKNWTRQELYEIAKDITNPDAHYVLCTLRRSSDQNDKSFARRLLRNMVTAHKHTTIPNYFYAMTNLWRSYPIVEEDRVLVRPLLRSIASDPSNPNAVQAATTLFYGNEDDKNFVRPILYQAANNQDHIGYETQDVASVLWDSAEAADKEVARQNFYEAVKRNPKAVHIFQRLLEGNEKDVIFALGHLQTMISEFGFSAGFDVSVWHTLWGTNKEEAQDLARPYLKGIALNSDSLDMARSIYTLWHGNDEDKEIARKGMCYAALVGHTGSYPNALYVNPNRYPEDKRLISRLSMSKAFRSIFSEAVSAESLEGKRKQKYFTMSQVLENQSIYFIIYEYVDDIINAAEDLDLQAAHGEAFVINN